MVMLSEEQTKSCLYALAQGIWYIYTDENENNKSNVWPWISIYDILPLIFIDQKDSGTQVAYNVTKFM